MQPPLPAPGIWIIVACVHFCLLFLPTNCPWRGHLPAAPPAASEVPEAPWSLYLRVSVLWAPAIPPGVWWLCTGAAGGGACLPGGVVCPGLFSSWLCVFSLGWKGFVHCAHMSFSGARLGGAFSGLWLVFSFSRRYVPALLDPALWLFKPNVDDCRHDG